MSHLKELLKLAGAMESASKERVTLLRNMRHRLEESLESPHRRSLADVAQAVTDALWELEKAERKLVDPDFGSRGVPLQVSAGAGAMECEECGERDSVLIERDGQLRCHGGCA